MADRVRPDSANQKSRSAWSTQAAVPSAGRKSLQLGGATVGGLDRIAGVAPFDAVDHHDLGIFRFDILEEAMLEFRQRLRVHQVEGVRRQPPITIAGARDLDLPGGASGEQIEALVGAIELFDLFV